MHIKREKCHQKEKTKKTKEQEHEQKNGILKYFSSWAIRVICFTIHEEEEEYIQNMNLSNLVIYLII